MAALPLLSFLTVSLRWSFKLCCPLERRKEQFSGRVETQYPSPRREGGGLRVAGGSGRLGEAAAADPVGFSYPGEGIVTKSQNQIG